MKEVTVKMIKAWKHFITITHHRLFVLKGCFAVGLIRQGLMHDLSKYSFTEFIVGAKYYHGDRSPNNAEREAIGYSSAWLHHKGRNKHHFEYWIDYSTRSAAMVPVPIPRRYVVEMFMDRIAASKIYKKELYTDMDPYLYYQGGKDFIPIHDETRALLEEMLEMLSEKGEKETFRYIKEHILGGDKKK